MAADQRRRLEERRRLEDEDLLPDEESAFDDTTDDERDEDEEVGRLQALLSDRRKLATGALLVVLIVVAIYVLLPNLIGAGEAVDKLDEGVWYWIVIAVGFNVLAFVAYVALFRGVLGGTHDDELHRRLDAKASYQITMAGLAATRIFSAGGAGGLVLTYWALRKAGMPRRRAACRMVAFLVLTYSVYLMALVVFGILLRTHVLPGAAPIGGTIVPAALAAGVMAIFLLIALIPQDFERRIQQFAGGYRRVRYLQRLAKGPATLATGTRTALAYLRHPQRGALAVIGAVGFWAANIAVLWASFEAFGGDVPLRRARAGLLRRHGRQPDSVARGRRRLGRRGDDLRVRRPVRSAERRGVSRRADLPRHSLLAADTARESSRSSSCAVPWRSGSVSERRRAVAWLHFRK